MMPSMWDAAFPPAVPPAGFAAAAGYIGGDTPHVWTAAEWAKVGTLAKLPIWVRSDPAQDNPVIDAFTALRQLWHIGCPPGSTVVLDLETAVSRMYVTIFGQVLHWAGFTVLVYGSKATVFGNPPLSGYWVADWTGSPHLLPRPVRAVQWTSGQVIDRSQVRWWWWRFRMWR